eukprot:scaffold86193_cov24-Tisochrysis_lutea.AAC.1
MFAKSWVEQLFTQQPPRQRYGHRSGVALDSLTCLPNCIACPTCVAWRLQSNLICLPPKLSTPESGTNPLVMCSEVSIQVVGQIVFWHAAPVLHGACRTT